MADAISGFCPIIHVAEQFSRRDPLTIDEEFRPCLNNFTGDETPHSWETRIPESAVYEEAAGSRGHACTPGDGF